jgi:glyoxylase-like metal-dependent hydrolase (beta-lactamase superfamily II)
MPTSRLREILPDVFTWPWFSERHGYDFNGYLFRHSSGNIAVDPVEMPDSVLGELATIGVATILITNRNHTRASRRLSEATGARVAIHPADAAHAIAQGTAIDGALHVGERMGPFTVLSVAGKSPGEVALHWPERKILVVGDACVGKPPGECALLPESVMDDAAALRGSLVRLARTTDFDVLLLGDGAPILRGGHAALERLVASFGD